MQQYWRLGAVLFLGIGLSALTALAEDLPRLQLSGDAPSGLEDDIRAVSVFLQKTQPVVSGQLSFERQRQTDLQNLQLLLNNYGYYDPVVTYLAEGTKLEAVQIDLGPRYLLADYTIAGMTPPPDAAALGLSAGKPVLARALVDAETRLLALLAETGHPLAQFSTKTYTVDHDAHTLSADLAVEAGPAVTFGAVHVSGNAGTADRFLLNRAPWKTGQSFAQSELETYRRALLETELFSSVKVTPGTEAAPDGSLPIAVDVTERKSRSFGGSAGYNTDRGMGAEAFWQHRNMWRHGERVDVSAAYYTRQQSLAAHLRVPDWLDRRTALFANVDATNQSSAAYDSFGVTSEVGLERKFSPLWSASLGTHLFIGSVNNDIVENLAVPLTLSFDSSNDKLNPTRGYRSTSTFTPVIALRGEQAAYATWQQQLSGYFPLRRKPGLVLGLWGHVGGVLAAGVTDIAPTSRFYSGGGGSVRGYQFRSIGDKDTAGDPLGGTALAEGGAEIRFTVTDTIGGVIFAEAGSVSDTTLPDFSRPQYAAGLGVRYQTSIAPLRADIAVPLNRRNGDPAFQFYISLGQAF